MKTITPSALLELATQHAVLLAEYRTGGQTPETIKWRDKQTGTPQEMQIRRFNMETPLGPLQVSLPRDAKSSETLGLAEPFDLTKGTTYVLCVRSIANDKGTLKATATILPFSPAEGPRKA